MFFIFISFFQIIYLDFFTHYYFMSFNLVWNFMALSSIFQLAKNFISSFYETYIDLANLIFMKKIENFQYKF